MAEWITCNRCGQSIILGWPCWAEEFVVLHANKCTPNHPPDIAAVYPLRSFGALGEPNFVPRLVSREKAEQLEKKGCHVYAKIGPWAGPAIRERA